MDVQRLKIKVGDNEFEAEGPPESVQAQFEAWKALIESTPAPQRQAPEKVESEQTGLDISGNLPSIFSVDERKKSVTLAVLPPAGTGNRDADALILLLYGYKAKFDLEDVIVGRLKESMAHSGRKIERLDRTIQPYIKSGYVLKGGQGKGGKYRLTNTGIGKAKELIQSLT